MSDLIFSSSPRLAPHDEHDLRHLNARGGFVIGLSPSVALTRIAFESLLARARPCMIRACFGATKTQKHEDPLRGRAGVPGKRGEDCVSEQPRSSPKT
jgi:hypothetical protein